ncbi:MAG: LacI family DNA-binding transcriptional regulator [Victivallales bacterium]|nr:LacI family DNA-binding transcriptional regulator [Victivallales bacterium]
MTLKEMGEELGISPSTISKVLNGCTKNFTIPDELRSRILTHVEERGYSPNPVFRSMRVNKNKQIACFFYSRSSYMTGNTAELSLDAAILHLEKLNYEVYYQFCTQARKSGYPQPNWKVAGILIPDVSSADQLIALEKKNQSYVAINGVCGPQGTAVQADEIQNMKLTLEHLYELGHQRIAYVYRAAKHQELMRHYSSAERLSSYYNFMKELNLEPIVIEAVMDAPEWKRHILEIAPSAVIAGDESLGSRLFRAAYDKGMKIPEDMSMIVFNDADYLASMVPAISSVRIPAYEMGSLAGQIMEAKIKDPTYDMGITHRLQGKLILRETTARLKTFTV